MLKVEREPLIRLYRAEGRAGEQGAKVGFKREVAAEWRGLLIGYEVLNWFKSQQAAVLASHNGVSRGHRHCRFRSRGHSHSIFSTARARAVVLVRAMVVGRARARSRSPGCSQCVQWAHTGADPDYYY